MSVATDARAEFERMIRVGDEAILSGIAPGLLSGSSAIEAHDVTESYRKEVERLEAAEGVRWDGDRHVPES
jgi:hypothetical protein